MSWYTLILMVIGYLITLLVIGEVTTKTEMVIIAIVLFVSVIWYLVELKGKKK